MASPTKTVGVYSELAVAKAFAGSSTRCTVLFPMGDNEPYDLVAHCNEKFYRVQVKTGRLSEDGRRVVATLSKTRYNVDAGKYQSLVYTEGMIDLYAVFCPQLDETFLLPESTVLGQGSVTIFCGAEMSTAGQIARERVTFDTIWPEIITGAQLELRLTRQLIPKVPRTKIGAAGYIGVTRASSTNDNDWTSYIMVGERGSKQRVYIGRSSDPRALALKYDAKAIELLGPDAVTNRSSGLLDAQITV